MARKPIAGVKEVGSEVGAAQPKLAKAGAAALERRDDGGPEALECS